MRLRTSSPTDRVGPSLELEPGREKARLLTASIYRASAACSWWGCVRVCHRRNHGLLLLNGLGYLLVGIGEDELCIRRAPLSRRVIFEDHLVALLLEFGKKRGTTSSLCAAQ